MALRLIPSYATWFGKRIERSRRPEQAETKGGTRTVLAAGPFDLIRRANPLLGLTPGAPKYSWLTPYEVFHDPKKLLLPTGNPKAGDRALRYARVAKGE